MTMSKRSHDSISASEERSSTDNCSRSSEFDHQHSHIAKSVVIERSDSYRAATMMQCSLPPHAATLHFASLETFEIHYAKEHTNRCAACGKNLPSAHFLALHLDEVHNPVREVLAAKGEKTYACLVEDCDRKCSNPTKRRLHLIDKHGFPKAYNFRVVHAGLDQATSLLREGQKRRVSIAADPPSRHHRRFSNTDISGHVILANPSTPNHAAHQEDAGDSSAQSELLANSEQNLTKGPRPDDHMDELETSLSALSFIPRSVLSRQTQK